MSDLILKINFTALFSKSVPIQSYFEAGIPDWDPKLRPPNSQKCNN